MDKVKSKRLVIDADVLHAAGDVKAIHPTAKHCHDFLEAVLDICHCAVRTPAIYEEWHRHCSRFARLWMRRMFSRGKVAKIQTDVVDRQVLHDVEKTVNSDGEIDAVRKDIHLIHAALAADRSIVSCDETARRLFGDASSAVPDLSPIVWVNPDREEEKPIQWLKDGAEAEPDRMLCRRRK